VAKVVEHLLSKLTQTLISPPKNQKCTLLVTVKDAHCVILLIRHPGKKRYQVEGRKTAKNVGDENVLYLDLCTHLSGVNSTVIKWDFN
jgi:hypothetical protein